MPRKGTKHQKKGCVILNDLIWPISCGGLLRAANILAKRCGISPPTAPQETPLVSACLAAAEKLILCGKEPCCGLHALASPFGHLGASNLTSALGEPWAVMRGDWKAACPKSKFGALLSTEKYKETAAKFEESLPQLVNAKDYSALEHTCEDVLAFLPLFPDDARDGDISLYDYGRMTAALASCFALAAAEAGELPPKHELFANETLLLFSCDFSGIQSFIYLISTKSALRMLRSRSFYLELVMEHLIDELLDACGLSRANCIYAGGGHSYVLLPNTVQANEAAAAFEKNVNTWLREQFGAALYLSCAVQPCSPSALFGSMGQEAYSEVFRSLSAKLGHRKLTRWDAAALRAANSRCEEGRECKICGRAARDAELCDWCSRFAALGGLLTAPNLMLAVSETELPAGRLALPLPSPFGPRFVCLLSQEEAHRSAGGKQIVRWYSKNGAAEGFEHCRRLWVGDHCPDSMLEKLCEKANRLGVFRADVDNLGASFISGFGEYTSLLRTAAFSRCISIFFKRYINQILDESACGSSVLVVYSGGDDLFLVGAWSELLQTAQELQTAFKSYTGGALTFSGGFGLYNDHYPIARAAQEVAELEDFAKKNPRKNSIALFAAEESLRFDWPAFQTHVMGEKYALLNSFFGEEENARGSAFLYKLLDYLRSAGDRLNLARCAYLLARLKPTGSASAEQKKAYAEFSSKFYAWALEPAAREQLIAAIYLYVYLHRSKNEKED